MNPVQSLFHQAWIARLGWTLLHFLWQGTLIAALFGVTRALPQWTRSAQGRYAAACAALAAMAVAPLLTFLLLSGSGATPPAAAFGPIVSAIGNTGQAPSLPYGADWEWLSPRLGAAWLVGVTLFSLRLLGGWLVALRLQSTHAKPAPEEWQSRLQTLMAVVGVPRRVRLRVSPLVETPMTIGWLRPVILVPLGALAGLPAAYMEALLAHELAHIRRHDYLVNLVQSVAEALLFYHPAVWWISHVMRVEREHCCDDLAVQASGGDVLSYARALAEVEGCRPAHAHAMAANSGSLRNRIVRLLDPTGNAPAGGAVWALLAILLIAAGGAAVRAAESPAAPVQETAADMASVMTDTVKQGDLEMAIRGLGSLLSPTAAEIKVAITQARDVREGQPARIGFPQRQDAIAGRVRGIRPGMANVSMIVEVAVLDPLPAEIHIGDAVDGTVVTGSLANVVFVGRPVFAAANSESNLFRIDPDGKHATRVPVQFGRASVSRIEIKSGLQPGDRVILSDMKAYEKLDRIALK